MSDDRLAQVVNGALVDATTSAIQSEKERAARVVRRVFTRNMMILEATSRFSEIEPDTKEPPVHWVTEFGTEQAAEMLRIARAAWMSAKEAPIAIKVATQVAMGVLKVEGQANKSVTPLRVDKAVVVINQETAPIFKMLEDATVSVVRTKGDPNAKPQH